MAHLVVTSEAVFDAAPERVWAALIDEMSGATHWWRPYWEARPRRGGRVDQIGAEIDITVHPRGCAARFARSSWTPPVVSTACTSTGPSAAKTHGASSRMAPARESWSASTPGRTACSRACWACWPTCGPGHANVMREGFERLARWLVDDAKRIGASR